jgi:hypothetical protein
LDLAWPAGRFEADEFGAAFVAANKTCPGDIRLMPSCEPDEFPADIEYHYQVMQAANAQLIIRAYAVHDGDFSEFFYGRLKDFVLEFSSDCIEAYLKHFPSKSVKSKEAA